MWRTLFMAFGVFVILLGAQCLVVEKFVFKSGPPRVQTNWAGQSQTVAAPRRQIAPTEWAPFSLMAGGSVVWLYAISISSRMKK
jgi:hypothetical protein